MVKRNTLMNIAKRRQQLTRQLVIQMMDKKPKGGGTDTPGLLTKLMNKLEDDLDNDDYEISHKAMDKIIKLMPFVIAKEKGPALQLNVQNNIGSPQISAGKSTTLAIGTIENYLKVRDKQMQKKIAPIIEEAQIVEFEEEDENEE